jgi:signal transduction histidine kinase
LFEGHSLQLEIRDDGIGFDPTRQYEGFGLMGMSERANRIGGKLTVLSLPGKRRRDSSCAATRTNRDRGCMRGTHPNQITVVESLV